MGNVVNIQKKGKRLTSHQNGLKKLLFISFFSLFLYSTSASAILSGLPSRAYFEADDYYPYSSHDELFLTFDSYTEGTERLLATRYGNKIRIRIFEALYLAKAEGREQPTLLYQSPSLLIAPTALKPFSSFETEIHYNSQEKSLFIAYGIEYDEEICLDFSCIRDRSPQFFEYHGYLLFPTITEKRAEEETIESAAETIQNQTIETPVIAFDGFEKKRGSAAAEVSFTLYTGEWNAEIKQQANHLLKQYWRHIYEGLSFPTKIEYILPKPHSTQLEELSVLYRQVATTRYGSKEFRENFALLDDFFKRYSFQELDQENSLPHYTIWLTDYAYWLLKENKVARAEAVLQETIKRGAGSTAKYLLLADAQRRLANRLNHPQTVAYYRASAKDMYREFCWLTLEKGQEIKQETADRIKKLLSIDELTLNSCTPHHNLFEAVIQGKLQDVETLLERGFSPNTEDYKQYPLLVLAIERNNYEMTELLLKKGADPTAVIGKDNSTRGIFYYAYQNLHKQTEKLPIDQPLDTRLADLLLAYGADIDAPTSNGSWVLMDAVKDAKMHDSDPRAIRYLLAHGANPQLRWVSTYTSPLIAALERDRLDIAQILMGEESTDVNYSAYSSLYGCGTPLIFFLNELRISARDSQENPVNSETIKTLEMLFAKGADPTLGGRPSKEGVRECGEKNGWTVVEMLAEKIPSPELKQIIEQHRPLLEHRN